MRFGALLAIGLAACAGSGAAPGDDDDIDADAAIAVDPDARPFTLDAHTELVDGALALLTNLPPHAADCPAGGPCGDLDADGLTDAWEDLVLDRMRPVQRFDEDEQLLTDPGAMMGDIGRVAPTPGEPFGVIVFVVLAYSIDYGSCGVSGHDGDPERVALHLVGIDGGVRVAEAYTAAHEYTAGDRSATHAGTELVYSAEPRWVVFPSRDKHGTYATVDGCESSVIPCVAEQCAPDGVAVPGAYDRVSPVVNAGEDTARLVEDLGALGFPGDDAWADQDFCGGHDSTNCSAKIRDKLTIDPFGLL